MKSIFLKFLTLSILIGCLSCKKNKEEKLPSADFIFDKSEYTQGETVPLINKSINATTYRWTFADGQTGKSTDASFIIPPDLIGETIYSIKLEAFSESGFKTDYCVKNVKAKVAKGKVVFSTSSTDFWLIDVHIDGALTPIGNIPYSATTPQCGQTDFPTIELRTGSYSITVKYYESFGQNSWTKTINLGNNECVSLRVGS